MWCKRRVIRNETQLLTPHKIIVFLRWETRGDLPQIFLKLVEGLSFSSCDFLIKRKKIRWRTGVTVLAF